MPPRAYWKGYLRLSLVTCPIELHPATSLSERTHFHMINRKNAHRLHQQMLDEKTAEVIDLMEALKRSLHGGKGAAGRGRSKTTRRRTTGRARKAA